MVDKIQAWKTLDGKVFENECDALNHDRDLKLRAFFKELFNSFYYYSISESDIINHLMDNKDKIREILNGD